MMVGIAGLFFNLTFLCFKWARFVLKLNTEKCNIYIYIYIYIYRKSIIVKNYYLTAVADSGQVLVGTVSCKTG